MQDKKESIKFMIHMLEERDRQDSQWGGGDHDDQHHDVAWFNFIEKQTSKIWTSQEFSSRDFKETMIKIAALAMAAYQSNDRKNK